MAASGTGIFPLGRKAAIPLLILLALVLRLLWPLADPVPRFSWSNGIYTDPPTMVHAARNAAISGEWVSDYNRDLFVYPLMNWLTFVAFRLFGPGRLPTVILSALAGAATVVALAWGLRRSVGPRAAVIGLTLGAVNFWLVMFSRIPVSENVVGMMLALACVAAVGRSPRSQVLAGALGVAATLFGKYHALGFLPGLVLLPWLRERSVRATIPALAGGTLVLAAWLVGIFLPHGADILAHVERQSTGLHGSLPFAVSLREGMGEFYNTLRRSWMFYRIPVCGALGGLFAIWTVGNGRARSRRVQDGSAIYAFWFLGMWTYFALLPYKAPRYYVLLGPPLVAGTAVYLDALLRRGSFAPRSPARWDEHVPLVLWLYSFGFGTIDSVKHYASMILEYLMRPPPRLAEGTFEAIVGVFSRVDTFNQNLAWAAVLAIVGYLLVLWNPEILERSGTRSVPAGRFRAGARVALVLSVGFALLQYAWWASTRTAFLEDVKSSLPSMVGQDAVLLGPMAPLLTQDTRHRVHPYFGPPGEKGLLEKYDVTHVVVCGRGDAELLEARFPGLLAQTTIVQVWPFKTLFSSTLEVRRLPNLVDGIRIHDYRPTLYERGAEEAAAGNWEAALERFDEYRRSGGREIPELLSLESVCWFKLEEFDKAEELLREAIRRRPLDPLNHMNLGILHLRRGDRARAVETLLTAYRLDPNNQELEKMLRELAR